MCERQALWVALTSDMLVTPIPGRITKEQSLLKEKLVLMEAVAEKRIESRVYNFAVHQRHICTERTPSPGERLGPGMVSIGCPNAFELVQVAVQERLVRKGAQCSQDPCSLIDRS